MIPLFAGAKGKTEFKETDDEIEIAFEIGRLSAKSGGKSRMNVAELMSSFSLVFYQSAEDAVFKALVVE